MSCYVPCMVNMRAAKHEKAKDQQSLPTVISAIHEAISGHPAAGHSHTTSPAKQRGKTMRPLFLKIMDYLLLAILIGAVTLASCNKLSYAQSVHPHGELALVGYEYLAHTPRLNAVFLCVPFGTCLSMAKLEGEAFALASYLDYWSTNPFQLCHPYLVVNGKASKQYLGAHTHA